MYVCMCVRHTPSCVSSRLVSFHLVSSRLALSRLAASEFRDGSSESWTRTAVNAIKSGRGAHVRPLPQNIGNGELVAVPRQVKHN